MDKSNIEPPNFNFFFPLRQNNRSHFNLPELRVLLVIQECKETPNGKGCCQMSFALRVCLYEKGIAK